MKTKKVNTADRLTNELTAFRSFREMLEAMRRGYVPTFRRTKGYQKLARIVEGCGCKVWYSR